MLSRTPLFEYSVRSDKKLGSEGGIYNRDQSRDVMPRTTSLGATKGRGSGIPHYGRELRRVPRGGGELLTDKRAPAQIELKRGKSAHRKEARRKRSYIGASVLNREPLLLDHHDGST